MNLVEEVLADYPSTRNSDMLLIIRVWERQLGRKLPIDLVEFLLKEALNPESICRNRRKLQQFGHYKSSKQVEEFRFQNFVDAKYSSGNSVFN